MTKTYNNIDFKSTLKGCNYVLVKKVEWQRLVLLVGDSPDYK